LLRESRVAIGVGLLEPISISARGGVLTKYRGRSLPGHVSCVHLKQEYDNEANIA